MSKSFEMAKKYYEEGLWSKERIKALADKGVITSEEYTEIVGEE